MTSIYWAHLNWIDYTIIGVLLVSLLVGVIRGFVAEVISLTTWVVAFLVSYYFAGPLAQYLTFADSLTVRYGLAFAAIFILILVIGITINVLVRGMFRRIGVPVTDRLLGLAFGIARGIFIVAIVLLFIRTSPLQNEPKVKQSQLIPPFKGVVDWLQNVLPEKITHIKKE